VDGLRENDSMAFLFELAADCGNSRARALAFGRHFDGLQFALTDEVSLVCRVNGGDIWQLNDKSWWCRVVPEGASLTGLASKVSSPERLVELARLLYERLRTYNGFSYARVGWEVEGSLDEDDWIQIRKDISSLPPGVVVGKDRWIDLGAPKELQPFGLETFWIPLHGSDYQKLVQWL